MKILIVDDSPENLLLLTQHLKTLGYETVSAKKRRRSGRRVPSAASGSGDHGCDDAVMDGYRPRRASVISTPRAGADPIPERPYGRPRAHQGLEAAATTIWPTGQRIPADNKIMALHRIADMQDQVTHYARELQPIWSKIATSACWRAIWLDHIIRQDKEEPDLVRAWVSPAQHFSGDVVMTARSPVRTQCVAGRCDRAWACPPRSA